MKQVKWAWLLVHGEAFDLWHSNDSKGCGSSGCLHLLAHDCTVNVLPYTGFVIGLETVLMAVMTPTVQLELVT